MEKDQLSRKLAVILHADVVDSTALVRQDETLAHKRIQDAFQRFSQLIASHDGLAHEIRGDALVAEFPKASDAVAASIEFQAENLALIQELPDQIRPAIRIGIAMGEVVVADNTVTGEGVVLAQRLEQSVKPGGICIQGAAYETVPKRLPYQYESMGELVLKGFDEPLRAYAVTAQQNDLIQQPGIHPQPENEQSALTTKPSIAVLPFDNMSGDPEQEYFSDGITEDIITQLTRFRSLFVIARNSSFAFKGKAVDVTEIGKKLGVQFVVEGSVRKAGDRIRITAQLIEVSSGNHLWAERYDRSLSDIFAVQDEVTSQIVTMVPGHMDIANRVKAERKSAQDMNAYDLFLRAKHILHWNLGSREGEQLLKQALEIDPSYAQAHARLAAVYGNSIFAHGMDVDKAASSAHVHAETAMKLDPTDPMIHASLADVYIMAGEHALAAYHIDKAIALNPNQYEVMALATEVKAYLGDYHAAIKWANKAKLSDPYLADNFRETIFEHHYFGGQYELALEQMTGWRDPGPYNYLEAAAAFAQLDRKDEAQEAIQQFEDIRPEGWNMEEVIRAHVRMCAKPEDAEHWVEGFRKAGLDF